VRARDCVIGITYGNYYLSTGVDSPSFPSIQLDECRRLTNTLESTLEQLRVSYSAVPLAELVWLYSNSIPDGTADPDDAGAMGTELAALELQQLLLGVLPASATLPLQRQGSTAAAAAVGAPQQDNSPALSIHAASMALSVRGKFRNSNAHLGLKSGTPKNQRKGPWLGHQNLGKRRPGIGEFVPAVAAKQESPLNQ
jgi:hypothetical protein